MSFIATGIAVGAGASTATILGVAGLGLAVDQFALSASGALSPNYPSSPDYASSSKALSDAQAELLPYRRAAEAAAARGESIQFPTGKIKQWFDPQTNTWKNGEPPAIDANQESLNQLIAAINGKPYSTPQYQTREIDEIISADFSGLGEADVQAQYANEMAGGMLDLNKKYGNEIIDLALEQQKLADPEGWAARKKENELIQKQINAKPERPVADELDRQISSEVAAANQGRLDPEEKAILDRAVKDALSSRGGASAAGADFERPFVSGFEGEQRKAEAAQKGISWMSSGATPEDTEYRREQQNLANLSAFVNGQSPVTQFRSLSGAQSGPVPTYQGQGLAQMPSNTGNAATSSAVSNYGTAMNYASNQVSPWTAGLSGALNIGGALGQAGWKPLSKTI